MKSIARRIFDRSGGYGRYPKYLTKMAKDEIPVKRWGNNYEGRLTYKDGSTLVTANPKRWLVCVWDGKE